MWERLAGSVEILCHHLYLEGEWIDLQQDQSGFSWVVLVGGGDHLVSIGAMDESFLGERGRFQPALTLLPGRLLCDVVEHSTTLQQRSFGGGSRITKPATTVAEVRFLHTSDWHVGRTMRGLSRASEHREVLAEIATIASNEEVDAVVVAGDTFDLAAPTPESEEIVYQAFLNLARVAPVVVVAGNHDNPRRLRAVAPLLDLGRVTVVDQLRKPEDGGVLRVEGTPLQIAAVPWQSQRAIVTSDDLMDKDGFEHSLDYAQRMKRVIAALVSHMPEDAVTVLVGHIMVAGAEMGGSERAVHTVFEYSVPALAFPGSLSYVALGHLHRMQRVPGAVPTWYSGSPLHLDFGERTDEKGVLVIDAVPGLPATVRSVPLIGGRRLIQLEGTAEQIMASAGEVGDAFVKVVLDETPRAGLADELRQVLPGVVDLVIRRPEKQQGRAPVPVRLGRPPSDLFSEYLEAKAIADPSLVALFSELLGEVVET